MSMYLNALINMVVAIKFKAELKDESYIKRFTREIKEIRSRQGNSIQVYKLERQRCILHSYEYIDVIIWQCT